MSKLVKQHIFLKDWRKYYVDIFSTLYPNLDKNDLKKFLSDVIEEKVNSPKGKLHNNYVHKAIDVDLLSIIDWIENTKPIVAGFGTFFKNQEQAFNPAAGMLDNFLTLRKKFKGQLKVFSEGSYEYDTYDRKQKTEKINSNSFYGASGAPTSNFFNIYTATAVTATGQSLISTAKTTFEAVLTNNVKFLNLDDCMNFMRNTINEERYLDDSFLPNISIELLIEHLKGTFLEYEEEYEEILFMYLMNLSQRDINRIYFKNNIFKFSKLRKIRNKLDKLMMNVEEFKNPNKIPKSIENNLKDLWDYFKEFVFYNQPAFDRISRLKTHKRKAVVAVDTDSNMVNVKPWYDFMNKCIITVNEKLSSRREEDNKFICVNTMAYILGELIKDVLYKYCVHSNILEKFIPRINMKNEFLFSRIILSTKKKRYVTSVRLREGEEIYPEKIDIKGMDFNKSSTREETKQYFTQLIKDKLLYSENINVGEILRELEKFEYIIRESLKKGEKRFLIPKSVKELAAYKDPFKEQGVRSVIAWNYLYPSNTISLPEKVDMIKVKIRNEREIEKLKSIDIKYYNIIKKNIFESSEKKIAEKGVAVISLPRNVLTIPEWIIPFIDYDTIINDNISKFHSVLRSLGVQIIKNSKNKEFYSNIIDI